MMSDEDDFDYTTTNRSSGNLANIFQGAEPTSTVPVASTAYVPPKQPKKDAAPRVMVATVIQTFSYGADQKWIQKGKMGVALLSTDNSIFQLIIYLSKTQQVTSVRINTSTVFTAQSNNYLSFQDDGGQNWSLMFDDKKGIVDFALQLVVAKAYLSSFKFDHLTQEIREGEGVPLGDGEGVEITVNGYKFLENGTIQAADTGETKPVRFKIGKQQNGKAFDDVLRGMKKGGQRVTMIGTILYSIEVIRIKREKDARSGSTTTLPEEHVPVEQKRTVVEEHDSEKGKNRMLERIGRMGGVSMMQNVHPSSAFAAPFSMHLSDDDSINNEFIQHGGQGRTISTPVPPVQFVPAGYPYPHHLQSHPSVQQPNMYAPPSMHDYNPRPASSMTGMPYQPAQMWPPSQYPPTTPSVPPTDMFYQQQQQQAIQPDFRQLLTRLSEKVDTLNDKFDTKISPVHANMETSAVLASIQRIVKENETIKKDLYDRSAKIEELNGKISELLDRNQRLIEQSHQTVEQRNMTVNNVSEQTAQKILDLEKQKVELTNNLSQTTSKIAELQLQLNHYTQDTNENQSRVTSLAQKCEQYKTDLEKSENQRAELQSRFDAVYEQYKNEKLHRKQFQSNITTLEEELAEVKTTCANFEKVNNERKSKYENERKRLLDDIEEQKQSYEKELDELSTKLRKQRAAENSNNSQEISRIEQELTKEWQDKLARQQAQHERLLNTKGQELEQLKTSLEENETKLLQTIAELEESTGQIQEYEERCEKFQDRFVSMKEKLVEINDEQTEAINAQVKQAVNIIFQRMKARIQPTKQYTGEQVLSRSLEIIKKATLKVLSNDEDDEEEEDEPLSDAQDENETDDKPINGNLVDQQTLREEVSSVQTETRNSSESETLSRAINPKNDWDTVDDLQQEAKGQKQLLLPVDDLTSTEQSQEIVTTEVSTITTAVHESELTSNPVIETDEPAASYKPDEEEGHASDGSGDTIEDKNETSSSPPSPPTATEELTLPKQTSLSDDDDDALFQSARPSIQDNPPAPSTATNKLKPKTQAMFNPDDSDDELFK